MTYLLALEPLLFYPGDRMSRDEFLGFWKRTPHVKFAELIAGTVHVPSPFCRAHARKDNLLRHWAGTYAQRSGRVKAVFDRTWLMFEDAPQPDIALCTAGGVDGGVPDVIIEMTTSSRSYDLGPKLDLYRRAGVREYVAALLEEERVEWRVLRDGRYELLSPDSVGTYRSEVLPGLWLNEPAFWREDYGVISVLNEGLAS